MACWQRGHLVDCTQYVVGQECGYLLCVVACVVTFQAAPFSAVQLALQLVLPGKPLQLSRIVPVTYLWQQTGELHTPSGSLGLCGNSIIRSA